MSTSKRYRLLVDLPDCPKYAIFERMEGSILYRSINPYTTRNNPYPMKSVYKNIYVENNPDFFELVDDKPKDIDAKLKELVKKYIDEVKKMVFIYLKVQRFNYKSNNKKPASNNPNALPEKQLTPLNKTDPLLLSPELSISDMSSSSSDSLLMLSSYQALQSSMQVTLVVPLLPPPFVP